MKSSKIKEFQSGMVDRMLGYQKRRSSHVNPESVFGRQNFHGKVDETQAASKKQIEDLTAQLFYAYTNTE